MAYSLSGERPSSAAWPIAAFTRVLHLVDEAIKARRQRVALAELLEMDEYRLWDLGIARADLTRALRDEAFDMTAVRRKARGMDIMPPR